MKTFKTKRTNACNKHVTIPEFAGYYPLLKRAFLVLRDFKILFSFFLCIIIAPCKAQDSSSHQLSRDWFTYYSRDTSLNFAQLTNLLDSLYNLENDSVEAAGKSKYVKWKTFWSTRIDDDGRMVDFKKAMKSYYQNNPCTTTTLNNKPFSGWKEIGPDEQITVQKKGAMFRIEANPEDPNEIYAGGWGGGVWATYDGGIEWKNITENSIFSGMGVSAIAVDYNSPVNQRTIYVGLINQMREYYNAMLIYSVDGGLTWTEITHPNLNPVDDRVTELKVVGNQLFILTKKYLSRMSIPSGTINHLFGPGNRIPSDNSALQYFEILPGNSNIAALSTTILGDLTVPNRGRLFITNNITSNSPNWIERTNILDPWVNENIIINGDFATNPFGMAGATGIWSRKGHLTNQDIEFMWGTQEVRVNPLNSQVPGNTYHALKYTFGAALVPTNGQVEFNMDVDMPRKTRIRAFLIWPPTGSNTIDYDQLTPFYDTDQDGLIASGLINDICGANYTGPITSAILSGYPSFASQLHLVFSVSDFCSPAVPNPTSSNRIGVDNVRFSFVRTPRVALSSTPNDPNHVYIAFENHKDHFVAKTDLTQPSISATLVGREQIPSDYYQGNLAGWLSEPYFKFFDISHVNKDIMIFAGHVSGVTYNSSPNLRFRPGSDYNTAATVVHVDTRDMVFVKPSGSNIETAIIAHDGGVSKWVRNVTTNTSTTYPYTNDWQNINGITKTINATTFHDVAASEFTGTLTGGTQDNEQFTYFKSKDGTWHIPFGIGGDCYVSGFSKNIKGLGISTSNGSGGFGQLWESNDDGNSFNTNNLSLVPVPYYLGIPYCMSTTGSIIPGTAVPTYGTIIANNHIYDHEINSNTWSNLTNFLNNGWPTIVTFNNDNSKKYPVVTSVERIDNGNKITYAALNLQPFSSGFFVGQDATKRQLLIQDNSTQWLPVNINSTYPVDGAIIKIETDPGNANKVWVLANANGGYQDPIVPVKRIWYSDDKGQTWQDPVLYSQGLPNVYVSDIIYEYQSRLLFTATDVGVFFKDLKNPNSSWTCLDKNMPHAIVTALEINYCKGKIYASTWGRGIWQCEMPWNDDYINQNDPSSTMVLQGSTPTVWDFDMNIQKNVIVKAGHRLIIRKIPGYTTTINMGKGKVIIVEPNAALVVDDATITNECGVMWGGIRVMGTTSQAPYQGYIMPQINLNLGNYGFSHCYNQGIVALVQNAKIENACIGVSTSDYYLDGSDPDSYYPKGSCCSGGIIVAENAKFVNNRKCVEYTTYNFTNQGRFLNCEFIANDVIADERYKDPGGVRYGTDEFITAWDVQGVRIENCSLRHVLTNPLNYNPHIQRCGTGIIGIDAELKLRNNIFENIREGVKYYFTPLKFRGPDLRSNYFYKHWRGIYVSGSSKLHTTLYNHITLKRNDLAASTNNPYKASYGMFFDHCEGNIINENSVSYDWANNNGTQDFQFGIIVHQTSKNDQGNLTNIRLNLIQDLKFGIFAMGENKTTNILCNIFNNPSLSIAQQIYNIGVTDQFDVNLNPIGPGYLKTFQGFCPFTPGPIGPAGNKFTSCNSLAVIRSYKTPSAPVVKYNQHNTPDYMLNPCNYPAPNHLTPNTCAVPNSDCQNHNSCCPPEIYQTIGPEVDLEQIIDGLVNDREEYEEQLEDGIAQNLLDMIAEPLNSSAYVYNELMALGGILGDEILMATIDRINNPFSNYQLKNIMELNSPLSIDVYNHLCEQKPIVAYNYAVWYAQQQGLSPRDLIEAQIRSLKDQQDILVMQHVQELCESGNKIDAADYLLNENYLQEAFSLNLELGRYGEAQSISENLPSDVHGINMLCLGIAASGRNSHQLNTSEVAYLETLKGSDTKSGIWASNLLYSFNGIEYPHLMPMIEEIPPSLKNATQHPIYYEEILPDEGYELFPNPGNGTFTIQTIAKPFEKNTILEVRDLMGKLLKRIQLSDTNSQIQFELNDYPAGVYMISLLNANGLLYQSKLVKTP